jgi:hypothetical protein
MPAVPFAERREDATSMYAAAYSSADSEFTTILLAGRHFEASPEEHLRALQLLADIYQVANRE